MSTRPGGAGANGGGDARGSVTATASDGGIGKENKTDQVSDDGLSQSHSDGYGGSRWTREDGSSGTITVTGDLAAETTLSEPKATGYPGGGYPRGGYPGGGGGYPGSGGSGTLSRAASAFYSAVLSEHTEISSPIEESWCKGPYDSQHGTSRYLNQRKSDGSIQVDAGVTYQTIGPRSPEGWGVTDLGFMASDPFGSSSFSWTAGGPGWIDGQSVQQELLYTMGSSLGTFPANTSFSVTVTAPDGTTDQNTYNVKWHLPYEKNELIGTKKTKHPVRSRCEDVEPDFGAVVVETQPSEFDFSAAIDGLLVFVPEGAEVKGLVELLGKIAEMNKYEYGGEKVSGEFQNNDQNYKDAVKEQNTEFKGDEENFPAVLGPDSANYWLCKMSVKEVEHDIDKSWYADGYTLSGFDGNSTHVVASHVIDSVFSERLFTRFR